MNLLLQPIFSGVNFAKSASERRSILLSNIIAIIIFCLGIILFGAYYLWYGWSVVTAAIPLVALLALTTLIFNSFNLSAAGRILLTLLVPVCAIAISVYAKRLYYDTQEELDYFSFRFLILASCVFPAIFFSFKERVLLVLTMALGFGILMLHDPLHSFFSVPYRQHILKETNYMFTNVVVVITYAIMMGGVLFLKKISEDSEEKAENLIHELVEKNSEIEAQNLEILAQSENLNISQQRLQEAYETIAEQNEQVVKQNENLSTELVSINRDLSSTNNELIKHNNELRQFSYTVSHNLRGPVASLSGLINLLDSRHLNSENLEIFRHIKTSIERLETIIKDLTKIIDIRHELFHIRQKVDLASETKLVLDTLKRDIENNDVDIRIDLTQCSEIYSVRPMIHSILYNLIANAIKYRAQERPCEVTVRSYATEGEVFLEVSDNGLGIDLKNQKQNLFRLYKRFHFHTEGRGLGLYLVKLQAEALGGRVDVESEVNRYTRFTVSLSKPENVTQQLLFAAPHARIFYDASMNLTGVIWKGPVSSEQYRTVFAKCLDFVRIYNTPNYLADLSNQGYISREDQQWMFSTIMPEAAKDGLKRIAAIRTDSSDPKLQEYFRGIEANVRRLGIRQQFFESYNDALAWFSKEPETVVTVS